MSQKLFDFLSSVGIMFVGVVLLLVSSITIETVRATHPKFLQFPTINSRTKHTEPKEVVPSTFPQAKLLVPVLTTTTQFSKSLTAVAVVVVDDKTDTVLFSKNAEAVWPVASISKLMSAMVLLDSPLNWSSSTSITSEDYDGLSSHVKVGEKFTLEQLWNIALIGSSNTAISALVRESGTSTRGFAELMNAKARDLKLSSLSFAEPTGLSEYNVGSSLDIARLLKSALSKEKITKALSLSEYDIVFGPQRSRKVWNTDWLLTRWIPLGTSISNVVGKTGYIGDSGYNFAARLTSVDDHSIRVVVLGTQSNEARFTEVRDLAEWVFNSYKWPN